MRKSQQNIVNTEIHAHVKSTGAWLLAVLVHILEQSVIDCAVKQHGGDSEEEDEEIVEYNCNCLQLESKVAGGQQKSFRKKVEG